MKRSVYGVLAVSAAILGSGITPAADRPARATVQHAIEVKTVTAPAEYAYDSTGWKPLHVGKVLHAGAFVRTSHGAVVLAMEEQGSLLRVGPWSKLELAKAAPAAEMGPTIVPVQVRGATSKQSSSLVASAPASSTDPRGRLLVGR